MILEAKDLRKSMTTKLSSTASPSEVKKGRDFRHPGAERCRQDDDARNDRDDAADRRWQNHTGWPECCQQPDAVKRIIGVQPQAPAFQDKTKLTEIIELFAAAMAKRSMPWNSWTTSSWARRPKAMPSQLSGGQRQRLSIAAALVHNPKVFFMDEPTTGLDPQARRNLWELTQQIRDKGVTVVMTTHYMDEAELLCDRVAIMDKGKIIAIDTPKNSSGAARPRLQKVATARRAG
jgi:ABC-type multidrug transport system ATPase subunit